MAVTVHAVERQERTVAPSLVFGTEGSSEGGWFAKVEVGPNTLLLSRLDAEGRWIVDGRFRGSLPIFHNGFGSRCTLLEEASDEVASILDGAIG